jgi:GMP synthase-like glutamine amidotransferase
MANQQANQLTIGILVTNTDHSDFAKRHDADGIKFTNLMTAARPDWSYKVYDCTRNEFPKSASECNGYVLGGSPASVNDDEPWIANLLALIRKFDIANIPMIGCCFGHQAIAKALGGAVSKNPNGWGFGVAPTHIQLNESWMDPAQSTLNLFAAHSEQVTALPSKALIVGGDDFCPMASFTVGGHFLTTQYHPEMTKPFFVGLTHAFEDYIGTDVAIKARQHAENKTDGTIFAHWAANFLEQAQR